ncbi:DUF4417 domain-containing protein [Desulfobacter vibrioformis]|uniref:DUF4417 domain-containing protein n=1 Tax=Desulfobacter vibrioformis TaxID=34031 RepID=UPI0005531174|nr:DUF4417 domain-containing protein [Desulfobacter vibrioformis]
MRQNGIPSVFQKRWPIETRLKYADLDKNLSWSPWGVFNSENIHCYTEDYRFEGCWRNPELSLKRVLDLNFVIAPDFSVYPSAPALVNRWQLYRSLAVFSYWQNMGVRVIPSINWVSADQIKQDQDLYPDFSIIAVRCPGNGYYEEWVDGIENLNKIIKPKIILHFGTKLGLEVWKNSQVFQFKLRGKNGYEN